MLEEAVMIANDSFARTGFAEKGINKNKILSVIVIPDDWIKCVAELCSTCFTGPHRALYH